MTGANGNLGSATLAALRVGGAAATGGSRTPGEGTRHLDFDDRTSLDLTGVSTLVLISAGYAEDDQVVGRHTALVDAAVRDGVDHVVYTSVTTAGDHLGFAPAHRATERLVRASGLPWTILRNGLYAELFGGLLMWADDGVESPFGNGALAAVAREDLAHAAAAVAANPARHRERVYDLVGTPITAGQVADRLGVPHRTIGLGSTGAGSSTRRQDSCRSSRPCSCRSPRASGTGSWTAPLPTSRNFSAARSAIHWPRPSRRLPPHGRKQASSGSGRRLA
ncbi:NAD(P)H-binding protein [Streptomyces bobili]|uniref:NAD(P)H-binding protein n=1 Tax=Streptomyces bobili TaxID=67280 RepID=UPI0037A22F84